MDTLEQLLKYLFNLGVVMIFITFIWFIITSIYPDLSIKNLFLATTGRDPATSTSSTSFSSIFNTDWLPAPKNYAGLLGGSKEPTFNTASFAQSPSGDGTYHYVSTGSAWSSSTSDITQSDSVDYVTYTYTSGDTEWRPSTSSAQANNTTNTGSNGGNTTVVESQPTKVVETAPADLRLSYLRSLSIYEKAAIAKGFTFTGEARGVMFGRDGKFPLVIIDPQGRIGVIGYASSTTFWATPGWVRFVGRIEATLPKNKPCTLIFESGTLDPATKKPLRFPLYVTCNG